MRSDPGRARRVAGTTEHEFSTRRVVRTAGVLVIAGAAVELAVLRSPYGALSLTLAGAVAIINFRWLEALLDGVIRPGKPRFDRWSLLRFAGRMALLAGVFTVLLLVPKIDGVAVAFGFSALVAALIVEGLRGARVGGG